MFTSMEHGLRQSQTQKMSLSPQMREYLRLLHLPVAELRQAVDDALEANPMLEEVLRPVDEAPPEAPAPESAEDAEDDTVPDDWAAKEPLVFTKDPSDLARRNAGEAQRIKDFQETLITRAESLLDYLEWQIRFLELDEEQNKIAEQIAGNINHDGYLNASLEEIATASQTSPDKVLEVLRKIQQLDPPGIGARDLREALLLQLERKGPEAALAKEIVRDHLDLMSKKDFKMLGRIFSRSEPEIKQAIEKISRLEPKPGRSFYEEEALAIVPDATIAIKDGTDDGLEIEIHHELIPELRINAEYRRMMREKGLDAKTKDFLAARLTSGTEFLKAIELRKSTLRTITEELVRAQPLFFTRGFAHLRPLRLKDIAERTGLHESTISRAIHGKYIKTPQGTIPYKSFFSQKVETANGEGESQKSIMERIRNLIGKEDPKKPLSDQRLVKILKAEGIKIARRTVAKYRELLKILPTHLRRQR